MNILQPPRLARLLRWDIAESPEVLRNKDGSLMACLRIVGPDLHSALGVELVAQAERLNTIFRRLEGTWVVQSESRRQEICTYPKMMCTDPISQMINDEREAHFLTPGSHWETVSTVTLTWKGGHRNAGSWKQLAYKNLPTQATSDDIPRFLDEVERLCGLLRECLDSLEWLMGEEALRYLHSTISMKDHPISMPEIPAYLDHYLTDMDLERVWVAGSLLRWPKLGEHYLRCVGVKRYPRVSHPGMFEILDELTVPYRACLRWLPLSRQQAISETRKAGGGYWSHKEEGTRVNKAAVNLADQAASFQQAIEENEVSGGGQTQVVVTWGETFDEATERAKVIERTLNTVGCVAKLETLNTLSAWLGTLPGEDKRNVRKPLMQSRNLSHMGPWHAQSRGAKENRHLHGAPLMQVTARGQTPYGFDTYADDVGHAFIVGPNGSGKSFCLNSMAIAWRQYPGNHVRIFDKDKSAQVPTYAVGGQWYDLGEEIAQLAASGQHLDDADTRPWGTLWEPPAGDWLCFETNALFDTPEMVPKILEPLIRSIKASLTGMPTMIVLDEGWRYLQESFFEGKVQDFFLTLRKANGMTVLCTQNPAHIVESRIGMDIYQQCATQIFLADPKALVRGTSARPGMADYYETLGLNERQREIVASLVPKKQYYVVGPHGCAVFDLCAGPIQQAIVGSSRKTDLALADELYAKDPTRFAYEWLLAKDLPDAALRWEELTCASNAS
jgi:type IV secretory pathway VirB4 component